MEKKELTKKLENFFYYYKWQTFFVVLGIILVIITVRQVTARIDYDTRIVFGGKITAIDPDIQSFNSKVKEMFADSNGDGEVNVLTTFATIGDDSGTAESNYVMQTKLQALLVEGKTTVFIVNRVLLEWLGSQEAFADLSDIVVELGKEIGESPYGVRISPDNPYFSMFSMDQEEYYLAIRTHEPLETLEGREQADYQNAYALLRAVMQSQ